MAVRPFLYSPPFPYQWYRDVFNAELLRVRCVFFCCDDRASGNCMLSAMMRFSHLAALCVTVLALAGCTEMRFVDSNDQEAEDDPRENIRLTGVITDMTSGPVVTTRVMSDEAIYNERRRVLTLSDVEVRMFNTSGTVEGQTSAETGLVFMAPDEKAQRSKNDIELSGNVVHRVPRADNPTTDSARLTTAQVRWDNAAQRFRGEKPFRMTMFQQGRPPVVAVGDGFVANKNLREWDVKHGAVGTDFGRDPRDLGAAVRAEMEAIGERAESGQVPPPEPVALPPELQ